MSRFAVIFFLLCSSLASGQLPEFHVQLLNESNGIQTANISTLARDMNGFLWVLSNRMVQRYDGQSAKRIEVTGEELLDIAIDESNRIWVSSASGIKKYINDNRGFGPVKVLGPESARFNKLCTGPGKKLWAMSSQGLYCFNEQLQAFEPFKIPGLPAERFDRRLLYAQGERLFVTTGPVIYCWDNAAKKLTEIVFKNVRTITALSDDILWLTNWNLQSFELDMRTLSITPINPEQFQPALSSPFVLIKNAFPLSKDEYLISTNHGCYCYIISTKTFRKCSLYHTGVRLRDDEHAFPNYLDREQNFWMILDEGIVFFKPYVHAIGWIRSTGIGALSWNNDIRAIEEDNEGNLWLATLNGFTRVDLNMTSAKSYRPLSAYDGYSFPSVRGLVHDGRNLIVGPTHGGLLIFDPVSEKFSKPVITGTNNVDSIRRMLESDFISGIYTRSNGQYLVLARFSTYLVYDQDYKIRSLNFNGASANTLAAAEDGKGNTWLASSEGITCVNDSLQTLFRDTLFDPSPLITTLLRKNDSTMWAGGIGLFEMSYVNGRVLKKKIIPELANQRIVILYKDKLGKFWIGADNGLYRYTEQTGKLEWFDVADNVQNKRFNPNSLLQSANGYIYLGGTNGLNYFQPTRITSRAEKLNVVISGVRVGQDDSSYVEAALPLKLSHQQRSIEFQFTTPYFHNPQKVQYRYRMQGLDSGWVYNGRNNIVRFSSLGPGKYNFRVAASLDGINWFEAKQTYPFVIKPAFWQTNWFLLGVALLAGLLVYVLLNNNRRKMERKETQKMIDYFALSGYDHATVEDIFWDIARNCISRLNFEDCVIYLVDEERKVMVQKAAYGLKNPAEKEIFNPIEIPVGKGIVGAAAASGQPQLVPDTSKDARYIVDDATRLSELAVPIIYGEKVIGVIDSEHHRRNFFKKKHLDVLLSVASLCANKIATVQAQQAALEKEQRVKELNHLMKESRLAALQSQMNPHFIFNAMNSIQRFTLEHDIENANKYISRFARLLRMVLQHSEKNAITLEDELQMLQLYLEIESLRMSHSFNFQIEVDEEIETDAVKIPGMMVQPFVENALAHGLANKPGEKQLVIRFYMPQDHLLLCEVTDNGIGREKARLLKERKESLLPHQSKGIALVKERLSLYNRQSLGKITITDLTNGNGEAQGTTVAIEIPVL